MAPPMDLLGDFGDEKVAQKKSNVVTLVKQKKELQGEKTHPEQCRVRKKIRAERSRERQNKISKERSWKEQQRMLL